jgi:sterol desaturase/sphingolipid hydroxylase (fatty acid hydroxylase superfamily)
VGFTLLSEMPSYLTDVLGFDLGSAGVLCVFPYLALFVSTLFFARLFDYLQRECGWKVDSVRKTAMFLMFIGSSTLLVICGFLPEKYAAYAFMILTQVDPSVKRELFVRWAYTTAGVSISSGVLRGRTGGSGLHLDRRGSRVFVDH